MKNPLTLSSSYSVITRNLIPFFIFKDINFYMKIILDGVTYPYILYSFYESISFINLIYIKFMKIWSTIPLSLLISHPKDQYLHVVKIKSLI